MSTPDTRTSDVENLVQELAEKVTDYGYNDEYGYYQDWKDGVTPIIREALTTFREEAVAGEWGRVKEIIEIAEYASHYGTISFKALKEALTPPKDDVLSILKD